MSRDVILIIDDDKLEVQAISACLATAGFTVLYAKDGMEGLKIIKERSPSLVLLDIQMPVIDGFKTLAKIRKTPEISHVTVLLMTSLNRENLKIKGLELGADDFFPKPIKDAELIAKVKSALRRSRPRISETGMKGDLSDVGLSDLLQSMEHASKTAVIRMDEIDGEIHIHEGSLIHVRQGRFKGYPGLIRIFLKESGTFSIIFKTIGDGMTGHPEPLLPLLIRVAGDVDEIRDLIQQRGWEQQKLTIPDRVLQDYPDIEKHRYSFPCLATDLIILMDHDPQTNLETLTRALKDGAIRIAVES